MKTILVESRCQKCREPIVKRPDAHDLCDKHMAEWIDDFAALACAAMKSAVGETEIG